MVLVVVNLDDKDGSSSIKLCSRFKDLISMIYPGEKPWVSVDYGYLTQFFYMYIYCY